MITRSDRPTSYVSGCDIGARAGLPKLGSQAQSCSRGTILLASCSGAPGPVVLQEGEGLGRVEFTGGSLHAEVKHL